MSKTHFCIIVKPFSRGVYVFAEKRLAASLVSVIVQAAPHLPPHSLRNHTLIPHSMRPRLVTALLHYTLNLPLSTSFGELANVLFSVERKRHLFHPFFTLYYIVYTEHFCWRIGKRTQVLRGRDTSFIRSVKFTLTSMDSIPMNQSSKSSKEFPVG